MAFLGAVLIRLALTDAYLRYVVEWMKWPLLATGVLLVLLAVGLVLRPPAAADDHDDHHDHHDRAHGVPLATWLLVVPGLVMFVIAPPELGSYLAERRSGEASAVARPDDVVDLGDGSSGPVDVPITEFSWRAQADPESIAGVDVVLTGFASYDGDDWFVTRLTIGCCAADAVAYQVRVDGVDDADRPERDQWVEVTGIHVEGTGEDDPDGGPLGLPAVEAIEVTEIDAPAQTYE